MKKYKVLDSLRHNGKEYAPGDQVSLPQEIADTLMGFSTPVVEPVDAEGDIPTTPLPAIELEPIESEPEPTRKKSGK